LATTLWRISVNTFETDRKAISTMTLRIVHWIYDVLNKLKHIRISSSDLWIHDNNNKKMHVSFLGLTSSARTDDPVSSFPSNKLIVTPHVCWTENYLWIKLHHHSTKDGRARNIVHKVFCWHGHISLHGWSCSNKGFINKKYKE